MDRVAFKLAPGRADLVSPPRVASAGCARPASGPAAGGLLVRDPARRGERNSEPFVILLALGERFSGCASRPLAPRARRTGGSGLGRPATLATPERRIGSQRVPLDRWRGIGNFKWNAPRPTRRTARRKARTATQPCAVTSPAPIAPIRTLVLPYRLGRRAGFFHARTGRKGTTQRGEPSVETCESIK